MNPPADTTIFSVTPTFRCCPWNAGNSDQTFSFPGMSGRARLQEERQVQLPYPHVIPLDHVSLLTAKNAMHSPSVQISILTSCLATV